MVSRRYRRWLLPSTVLIVALVIVGGNLVAWRYLGWPDVYATLIMNGMVAMGTLTLAVVAWIENQNTVRQMRIDRAKPGILILIAYWIDALHDALAVDQDRFMDEDTAEPIRFPRFGPITDPFLEAPIEENELPDRIIQEISEEYPSLPSDLQKYDQTAVAYQDRRDDLKSALEEYFEREFVDYLDSQQVRDAVQQYFDDNGMDDYSPEEYLTSNLNSFARTVLSGNAESGSYTAGYWAHVPKKPVDVREKEQFDAAFTDLEAKYTTLRDLNTRILDRIDCAREQLKDEYDIVESEVVELESGISRY